MIGVSHVSCDFQAARWVLADQNVWLVSSNFTRYSFAKNKSRFQFRVRKPKELDCFEAQHFPGLDLLPLPHSAKRFLSVLGIVASLATVGTQYIHDLNPFTHQLGYGAGTAVFSVVSVRDDNHGAFISRIWINRRGHLVATSVASGTNIDFPRKINGGVDYVVEIRPEILDHSRIVVQESYIQNIMIWTVSTPAYGHSTGSPSTRVSCRSLLQTVTSPSPTTVNRKSWLNSAVWRSIPK